MSRAIRHWLSVLVVVSAAVFPSSLGAQTATLTGRVAEMGSQRVLAGAQVFVVGGLGGSTNNQGRFLLLNVPAGSVTLRVEMIGYSPVEQSVTVASGETRTVDFAL